VSEGESAMEEGKCRTLAIRAGVCTQVRQVHLSYLVQVQGRSMRRPGGGDV